MCFKKVVCFLQYLSYLLLLRPHRNNRYFAHTNPYKYANRSSHVTMQRSSYKELLIYRAWGTCGENQSKCLHYELVRSITKTFNFRFYLHPTPFIFFKKAYSLKKVKAMQPLKLRDLANQQFLERVGDYGKDTLYE